MYLCFQYNIYLLYLPPHTSHVLQPLDLAIFSPLKRAYRRLLGNLSLLTDSAPVGKQNFLRCYCKARIEALIAKNIKSGWYASGLWPQRMAKPLMSRLLLENSNSIEENITNDSNNDLQLDWNDISSKVQWETPRKTKDIYFQASTVTRLGTLDLPTQRQLFRKLTTGFGEKEYALTEANLRIQQLEERLEQVQPRKRRKVATSPNSKFVNLRAIKQAQIEAGRSDIAESESFITLESSSIGDCIEVQSLLSD